MRKSSFCDVMKKAALVYILIFSCSRGFGQNATSENKTPEGSRQPQVQLSEELHTSDHIAVRLTPGQKKAIASSKTLEPDSAAVFRFDGRLIRKGPVKELQQVWKDCKDLQPISDKCWLCKDDNKIICTGSTQQNPQTSIPKSHVNPKPQWQETPTSHGSS